MFGATLHFEGVGQICRVQSSLNILIFKPYPCQYWYITVTISIFDQRLLCKHDSECILTLCHAGLHYMQQRSQVMLIVLSCCCPTMHLLTLQTSQGARHSWWQLPGAEWASSVWKCHMALTALSLCCFCLFLMSLLLCLHGCCLHTGVSRVIARQCQCQCQSGRQERQRRLASSV